MDFSRSLDELHAKRQDDLLTTVPYLHKAEKNELSSSSSASSFNLVAAREHYMQLMVEYDLRSNACRSRSPSRHGVNASLDDRLFEALGSGWITPMLDAGLCGLYVDLSRLPSSESLLGEEPEIVISRGLITSIEWLIDALFSAVTSSSSPDAELHKEGDEAFFPRFLLVIDARHVTTLGFEILHQQNTIFSVLETIFWFENQPRHSSTATTTSSSSWAFFPLTYFHQAHVQIVLPDTRSPFFTQRWYAMIDKISSHLGRDGVSNTTRVHAHVTHSVVLDACATQSLSSSEAAGVSRFLVDDGCEFLAWWLSLSEATTASKVQSVMSRRSRSRSGSPDNEQSPGVHRLRHVERILLRRSQCRWTALAHHLRQRQSTLLMELLKDEQEAFLRIQGWYASSLECLEHSLTPHSVSWLTQEWLRLDSQEHRERQALFLDACFERRSIVDQELIDEERIEGYLSQQRKMVSREAQDRRVVAEEERRMFETMWVRIEEQLEQLTVVWGEEVREQQHRQQIEEQLASTLSLMQEQEVSLRRELRLTLGFNGGSSPYKEASSRRTTNSLSVAAESSPPKICALPMALKRNGDVSSSHHVCCLVDNPSMDTSRQEDF